MRLIALVALATIAALPGSSRAESFHTCTGVITSLPTVITTQGRWCLQGDLATSLTTGQAIFINANNVTIDCNGFKVGNLSAGAGSSMVGIYAPSKLNIFVRGCNTRGFLHAITLAGGSGHVVEDNRVEGALVIGINVGDASTVRNNSVIDTGGSASNYGDYTAISAAGSAVITDNVIDGVQHSAGGDPVYGNGIASVDNRVGLIRGNVVRNILAEGTGVAVGIKVINSTMVRIEDNHVQAEHYAIYCNTLSNFAVGNTVNSGAGPIENCDGASNQFID